MTKIIGFHGIPAPRRRLAKMLRELADIIEADQAETEPHGIIMCLMGAHQFEVVGIGETEGWTGGRAAMNAVLSARYDTEGGNIRLREHRAYQPRGAADVVPLIVAKKGGSE